MEIVYKDEQVSQLSNYLDLPKTTVRDVLNSYIQYLRDKLDSGETIKFLNVCYLRVMGKGESNHETLAYISNELGKQLKVSQVVVHRILTTYEEFLIRDLRKLYSYSIRGLIKIRLVQNQYGDYKVRTKKSTAYNGKPVYVTTTGYFKRKAEVIA